MKIVTNDVQRGYEQHAQEYEKKALEVLRSGWYIMGNELAAFEKEWAAYVGTKHCVGVGTGLDALWIAVRVLGIGPGDEVIVQANTFIASVMGITINGATPVFVEPDPYYGIDAGKIEEKITPRTKAVLVVHLYGVPCQMDKIVEICKKYNLRLIEDCAQSHGATFNGQTTGTFGDIACFSMYPTKNLGAFGDAGCVVTNDDKIAEDFRVFRNYGSEKRYYNKLVGINSRLDELQAGLLRVKLAHMDEITHERREIASRYDREIDNHRITKPCCRPGTKCVWHQYVIRCKEREELIKHLDENGIGSIIHYPIPPHLSEAYASLGFVKGDFPIAEQYADEVLSIPMYNGMTEEEQTRVIDALNAF